MQRVYIYFDEPFCKPSNTRIDDQNGQKQANRDLDFSYGDLVGQRGLLHSFHALIYDYWNKLRSKMWIGLDRLLSFFKRLNHLS